MQNEIEKKALVEVKDLLGLSKSADRLAEAIVQGVGALLTPWQTRRINKAEVSAYGNWHAALEKSGLKIRATELSLEDRAKIRVLADDIRQQSNRESIAAEAVEDFKLQLEDSVEDHAKPYEELDAEWVDRFWRLAQNVTQKDMQAVWGRVLARQSRGTHNFSPRCLEALSLLTRSEATHLERMAKAVWTVKSGGTLEHYILTNVHQLTGTQLPTELDRQIRTAIGDLHKGIFGPAGIVSDSGSGWAHSAHVDVMGHIAVILIAGKKFSLTFPTHDKDSQRYIGSALAITPLGSEIFSLITAEPEPSYLKALKDAFEFFDIGFQST